MGDKASSILMVAQDELRLRNRCGESLWPLPVHHILWDVRCNHMCRWGGAEARNLCHRCSEYGYGLYLRRSRHQAYQYFVQRGKAQWCSAGDAVSDVGTAHKCDVAGPYHESRTCQVGYRVVYRVLNQECQKPQHVGWQCLDEQSCGKRWDVSDEVSFSCRKEGVCRECALDWHYEGCAQSALRCKPESDDTHHP